MKRRGARLAEIAALVSGAAISSAPAFAQPSPRRPPPMPRAPTTTTRPLAPTTAPPMKGDDANDLRVHFGIDLAQRLQKSSDADERLRGLARAAALQTPEGIALLKEALEATSPTRNDARAKIEVARGLAARTDEPTARAGLLALLTLASPATLARSGLASPGSITSPFGDDAEQIERIELARRTAAIALAQSNDPRSIEGLVELARGGGVAQAAAAYALVAFPPATLPLGNGTMTPSLLRLLADLGDLRALEAIRAAARASDPSTRAAAIVAMGDLGDARGAELARAALAETDPRLRAAGAEALVALDAPEKLVAVEALLGDDSTAAAGIRLAARAQSDGIVRALAARTVNTADPGIRAAAVAAIGRSASAEAVRALTALTGDALLRGDAADALARSPSDAAMGAIEALVTNAPNAPNTARNPELRRLGVRAYVVRARVRGETSGRMRAVIAEMARAENVADRALGTFARIALGEMDVATALADRAVQVRCAAAVASLGTHDARGRKALLAQLAKETDPLAQQALAAGLVDGDAEGQVPTLVLLDRAEAGGADAPLAAMAFARRARDGGDGVSGANGGNGGKAEEAKLDALLAARDPVLRAHVARGLASSASPAATGRLASAYTYEADATVRRALVAALAMRPEAAAPVRRATLALAARLDPDGGIRWIAQRALDADSANARVARSKVTDGPAEGDLHEVAWVRLVAADGAPPPVLAASFVRADGLAVPLVFDTDGYALVPGVPPGESRLVLAPRLAEGYSRPSP